MWSSLVKLALMGTDRRTPTASQLQLSSHPALHQVIHQLDWSVPEQALLEAAGAIALYQQARLRPSTMPCQRSIPASDDRPLCSAETAQHLRHALRYDPELCRDVLQGIAIAHQQIPPEFLPTLLDCGNRHRELQGVIHHGIGPQGRWLAAQNPDWHDAQWDWTQLPTAALDSPETPPLPQPFIDLWQTGTAVQRVMLCQQWRRVAPDAAREWMVADWSLESAKMRSQLITTLTIGLSLADEAFLESGLTDRSAEVRATAAQLLASLPDSVWCQRMTVWGRSLLTIHHRNDELRVDVTLPTPDPQAQPDSDPAPLPELPRVVGTAPLSSSSSFSSSLSSLDQQQGWFIQIIGSTVLAHWQQYGSPAELIRAATTQVQGALAQHPGENIVLQGWTIAALRQRNPVWADALLQHYLSGFAFSTPTLETTLEWGQSLLLVLPLPRREALLTAYVPPSSHHQTSLLQSSVAPENGAVDGETIAQWLQLAIASCPRTWPDPPDLTGNELEDNRQGQTWTAWSQDFSDTVLIQLQRELSHNQSTYIHQMQRLARPIGLRLAPTSNQVQAIAALKERNIPGSSYQQRLWLQIVETMAMLVNQRQAIWQGWSI